MPTFLENITNTVNKMFGVTKKEPQSSDIEARKKADDESEPAFGRDVTASWGWYYEKLQLDSDRVKIYNDIDKMDEESPEAASAFDAYADSALTGDSRNEKILNVQSPDKKIADMLNGLIKDIKLDAYIWGIVRNVAKYGDDFEEIVVDKEMNLVRLKSLPPHEMVRNEDEFGYLPDKDAFTQTALYSGNSDGKEVIAKFDKWQIIHFRSQRHKYDIYGTSFAKSSRKSFIQLCLMEDALIIARLTRANMRLVFAVDVEGMDEETAHAHITKAMNEKRKKRLVNPATGKLDLRNNPLTAEEDIFIGVRKDSKAGVTPIQGDINISSMKDIEHIQNKFISGLGVPKGYLGWERDIGAKATLTEQDIMFARRIRRLQYILQEGLHQLFDFYLQLNNIKPETANYTIGLPVISTVDSLREWRVEKLRTDIASFFKSTLFASDEWILRYVLGRSEDEISQLLAKQDPKPEIVDVPTPAPTTANGYPIKKKAPAAGAAPAPKVAKKQIATQQIDPEQLKMALEALKDDIEETNDIVETELGTNKVIGSVYKNGRDS